MSSLILSLFAFVAGCGLAWLWSRAAAGRIGAELAAKHELLAQTRAALENAERVLEAARGEREAAVARSAGLQAQLESERAAAQKNVDAMLDFEKKMQDSFASLATRALDANAQRLLELSRTQMEMQKQAASNDLAKKQDTIANLLKPMTETLEQLAAHSHALEVRREGAYQGMLSEIKNIQQTHMDLRRETTQLVHALRAPKVRGNWGEMQLRRCIEFAGMVEHASFEVEKFVRGEDSSVRPDVVVRLPNHRCIVIDAKTPLDAFLNAGACEEELQKQRWMGEHAQAVRKHLDALSGKAYWNRFRESPDFVVCFLPSEVLFSAALEQDPSLLEYSAGSNVLLATPTTLIALLKAVAYGWQQSQIARDAEIIRDTANSLYRKFVGMHESFLDIGKALKRAGDAYDDAVNKAEGRGGLFSIARKLRELKIGEKEIADSVAVAMRPRGMQHEDWQQGLALAAEANDVDDTLPQ